MPQYKSILSLFPLLDTLIQGDDIVLGIRDNSAIARPTPSKHKHKTKRICQDQLRYFVGKISVYNRNTYCGHYRMIIVICDAFDENNTGCDMVEFRII